MKGYCKTCRKVRKLVVNNKKIPVCHACKSTDVDVWRLRWKAFGSKKNVQYDMIDCISNKFTSHKRKIRKRK